MKKIWKRVLASVLAIVLCAGVFVTTNWQTVSAEDSSDGLKVIGASIRFINEDTTVDGIRFAVGVKADALTDETKSNYHLLVMPTALLTDGELTKGETYSYTVGEETKYAYAQDIEIDWAKATDETIDSEAYKVVRIYLNEIGADYYTTDVTARAYYQDGENAPVYSEAIERSYYSVANAALDDLNASEVADKYDNKVGNSYSPYDATQRDALLGVKYVKTGTWDYVDELLVQQSATASDSLTDRVVKTGTGEYTIRSAFKTKTIEEIGSNLFGGIQFAYNKATNTYLELDYRKYTSGDTTTLVPSIRGWDGVANNWSFYIGGVSGFTFEENTLYDVNIIVTETSTKMDVRVMCRKSGTSGEFVNAVNGSVTYGTAVFGDQIRFYAGRNLSGNTFSPKIVYSDKYNVIQDKGKTVTTTDSSFSVSGAASGTVTATALNKKVKANNNFVLSVDMVWEDRSTTNYKDTGFQIGGHNNIAQGSKGNFYFSPKGFSIHGTKYELATLAESIPGLANIVEKIAAGTPVTWTIVATPSTTDAANKTLITYYVDGIKCVSQEINKGTIYANYIMYHIPSNATFSNLDVTGEIPQPEYTPMYTTTGKQSLKLDQTLNADGTGTIKGQFIHDYHTTGSNVMREGIKFSGTDGNGYYFWISAQPNFSTPRFYVGLWKWNGSSFANADLSNAANCINYADVTVELKDNDEILVDYEITISMVDGKKQFDVTYTLSHDSWSETRSWVNKDNENARSNYRGGSVYLMSEDNGDPNTVGAVGDGKTVYNWITVNDKIAQVGQPGVGEVLKQTTGKQSLKLDQTLNADGTGTIKGRFIHDYHAAGSGNVMREGVKFSGTDGNGYYFWISAQPNFSTPRFYVGLWKWDGDSFENADLSNAANCINYADVTVELKDNDEIIVDFEIKISMVSGKKQFDVTYTLSHDSWSETRSWTNKDNATARSYYTGGDVYLMSEDNGDPNTANAPGDGKTVYNWILVDDSKAKVVQ